MFFASDNWAGAHPLIAESLVKAAGGYSVPYGEGDIDHRVERKLCELFERDVKVFFVGTGTAANALSLASVAKPASVMFCHPKAHARSPAAHRRSNRSHSGRASPSARPCGSADRPRSGRDAATS